MRFILLLCALVMGCAPVKKVTEQKIVFEPETSIDTVVMRYSDGEFNQVDTVLIHKLSDVTFMRVYLVHDCAENPKCITTSLLEKDTVYGK
jgi:hypothetical protein